MDNLEQFLKNCEAQIAELTRKCSEAEKNSIVLETEIKSLESQRDSAINECEEFIGMPFDKAQDVLDDKVSTLKKIMESVNQVMNASTADKASVQGSIDNLKKLAGDLGIEGA